MSRTLLHDWECSIEKNKNNTEELLKIAEDIYNTAYARGKASVERTKGEWEIDSDGLPVCKECGEIALQRIFVKMPHLIQDVRMVCSNYCPNCGADMRKPNCVRCDHFGNCEGCEKRNEE